MREMKESSIAWVGKIPCTWKVEKNKHCFQLEKNIVGEDKDNYELLSLTKKGIIKKDENSIGGKVPESFETYQAVKKDQLVMCLFDLDVSAVFSGLSNYDGMISPAYKVYNCNKMIDKNYAKYWFECCFDGRKYKAYSKSLRYVVNTEDFGQVEILLPPKEEQGKIAKFLNKRISEIDNVIEKTKESIKDYNKIKESILTNILTKGINNEIELEEINTKFINKKPKGWKIMNTLYALDMPITDGPHTTPELLSEGIPFISAEAVSTGNGKIDFSHMRGFISEEFYNECCKKYIPKRDDIYMIKSGATTGKVAIVDTDEKFTIWSPLAVFRCNKNIILPKFMFYVLQTQYFQKQIELNWSYGTQQNIGMRVLEKLKIIVPDINTQRGLITYLDRRFANFEKLIKNKEKILEELEKYKKSLIYEYVTGKKEVNDNKLINNKNLKQIKINCKDDIFAQAILLCKVIEKLNQYNLGRVKAEKTLYLIEKDIGFDFNNNYVREAAGPLSESIYKCESVISKKNKWIKVNKVKRHIEYEILSDFSKYSKYYQKYYSDYDDQIENIIEKVKNYSTDKSEMVATLYASWNDFLIKKEEISDIKIVKDVRENWNDTKKRFNEQKWLDVLDEMKQIELRPKGNGNLTIIKGNQLWKKMKEDLNKI